MIKYVLVGLSALFLVSCTQVNSNGNKTFTQGNDTVVEVEISMSKMDAVDELSKMDEPASSKLLFKASGTEPGWFAEFYNNKLRLVVDYGKDSILINDTFNISESDKTYAYSKIVGENNKNSTVSVAFNSTPCTTASGDAANRSVSIKFKNKEYKGCGNFVK